MADSSDGQGSGAIRVDTGLIRELAELVAANSLTEIEVEDGGRRIRVRRDAVAAAAPTPAAAPAHLSAAAAPAPAPTAAAAAPAVTGEPVKSPMVGTAYLAADPSGPPFVSVGKTVAAGDTLLIIEAMKVMNPIAAPRGGTVRQILVADAQPVEFDQPLMMIE